MLHLRRSTQQCCDAAVIFALLDQDILFCGGYVLGQSTVLFDIKLINYILLLLRMEGAVAVRSAFSLSVASYKPARRAVLKGLRRRCSVVAFHTSILHQTTTGIFQKEVPKLLLVIKDF